MENETNVAITEQTTAQEPEKTFTQAEVDSIVSDRLKREQKKYPTKEELDAYKAWKDDRPAAQERWNTLTSERDTARTDLAAVRGELEQMKRERILIGLGASLEDLDYYVFKVGKMVTEDKDFETAAKEFFEGLEQKQEPQNSGVSVNLTAPLTGGNHMTKADILGIKDTKARQRAIAENMALFEQ